MFPSIFLILVISNVLPFFKKMISLARVVSILLIIYEPTFGGVNYLSACFSFLTINLLIVSLFLF